MLRFDHEVFSGPRSVDTTTFEMVDPHTKKRIHAWKVQTNDKPSGLVATRRYFVDSPDSEILGGGVNMKGDRGVPLVREGNLFLWGFSGSPSQMTEQGRALFTNVVAYMAKFDGQFPTRRAGLRTRDSWRGVIDSKHVSPKRLPRYFGPTLIAAHGLDKAAYAKDLERREPYLYVAHGSNTLRIDADAEALELATNSLDLIRAAVREGGERGRRILDRYWPEDDLVPARPKTVAELDAIAPKLIFSEPHGYRWLSRPPMAGPEPWEIEDSLSFAEIDEPSEFAPAEFGARVVGSYNSKGTILAKRLGVVTLAIRAKVLEDWHLTLEPGTSGLPPVEIEVDLPDGMVWLDPGFRVQGTIETRDGMKEGSGTLTFTRRIWVKTDPGLFKVEGLVRFQACDVERCLDVMEAPFETRSFTVR